MNHGVKVTLITAAMGALLAIFLTIGIYMNKETRSNSKLRMGYPSKVGIASFDVLSITSIYQYELLRNLYGRLVRYNQEGQIAADIPERFYWENGSLVFEFNKKSTTIDGYVISAEDAATSLKRNIIYKKSGHGDIRNFLCPSQELKHISDACDGIEVVDNKLILKPVKEHYGPLLLTVLENVDYSIIPKISLNESLRIKDYKNTSGPYFVAKDSDIGEIKIQANTKHYLYSKNMSQEIDLIPTDTNNIWSLFLQGTIDLIPTGMLTVGTQAHLVLNDKERSNIHTSIPISTHLMVFSQEAIEKFSAEQRFFVGKIFSELTKTKFIFFEAQATETFFSKHSNGGLSDVQEAMLKNKRNNNGRPVFKHPIEIGVSEALAELFTKLLPEYSNEVKFIGLKTLSIDLKISDRPHVIIMPNDSSWLEDMGLIGYNLNLEVFKIFGITKDAWIKNYLSKENKEDRNKMLQDLHYENLINAYIYPFLVSPYFAVIKKPWVFNMSTLHAGTELWNIKIP